MALLQINVLGTSFAISANEDEEYLKNLLSYYTQITEEVKKSDNLKDPKQIAILAGILLCDELYKEKEKYHKLKKENLSAEELADMTDDEDINQITSDLISKIEKVLD
ncbi:MAG: cell division protein ZapA [Treponema sp.]|nr:cell division protein ZapA [Candidatus Treponema scatequi]